MEDSLILALILSMDSRAEAANATYYFYSCHSSEHSSFKQINSANFKTSYLGGSSRALSALGLVPIVEGNRFENGSITGVFAVFVLYTKLQRCNQAAVTGYRAKPVASFLLLIS
jgi:hypothetical protein